MFSRASHSSDAAAGGAPVALFVFNRPEQTGRVFERVRAARPARLLLVADGPRADHPGDARLCEEVRRRVTSVDWPCAVSTHFADRNLGCRARLSSGLDWVFSCVDEAIILEDDCLPHPSFFAFCTELLARYRDEERVHMVRGANFLGGHRYAGSSYYFSRFFHIWGWASWSRAWRHYDVDMRQWPMHRDEGWLRQRLPAHMVPLVTQIFDDTHAGRLPTWEFQWEFCSWLRDAVAIAPWNNLVTNIGFGAGGTHMRDAAHPYASLSTEAMRFPLRHPGRMVVDDRADLQEWDRAFPQAAGPRTLSRRLSNRIARFRSGILRALGS